MAETRGDRMWQRRKQLGLTTECAADLAGVSAVTWSRLETDQIPDPHISTIRSIARTLRVSVDWLEWGARNNPQPRSKYKAGFMDKTPPMG